jgi:hypothetical protein
VHTAPMSEDGGGRPRRSFAGRAESVAETAGINLYAEGSLHAQVKEYLSGPGDRFEVSVDGKVVDLLKADGEVVEVQTVGLAKVQPKVLALSRSGRRVRVVHPIAVESDIRRLDPATDELVSSRRSPKRGDVYELFGELAWATGLVAARNVSVEALLVRTAVTRKNDGTGSWRRKGDRTVDRELVEVLGSRTFRTASQWLALIPKDLSPPWTSSSLGEALGIKSARARLVLYCLARAGLIAECGKDGRRKQYTRLARRLPKRNGKIQKEPS